jgi:hypothetical protein
VLVLWILLAYIFCGVLRLLLHQGRRAIFGESAFTWSETALVICAWPLFSFRVASSHR